MSERTRLLVSGTRDVSMNPYQQVMLMRKRAGRVITHYWAKTVAVFRGREFFAEFLATFVLVLFGDGAIAQAVLSGSADRGEVMTINVGWAVGVMMGAYVSIGITGGHMNPAVTFAMALRGKLSWLKVIPYWVAQYLGAFVASVVLYGTYIDALHNFTGADNPHCNASDTFTPLCTGRIWATYPQPFLSLANGFLDQVVGTFLLVLGIFAICDSSNSEPQGGMKPLLIGFLLWGVGGSFMWNSGYAVNPARDFAPRVFTAIAGWGADVFVCSNCGLIRHWWWVPLVAPMVGGAIAGWVYWFFIDAHHSYQRPEDEGTYSSLNANSPPRLTEQKHSLH
ncbi:aquaporin-9-like [Halichondria panicea]|uniref:aquaporin-9-like n=1 Tax=Halichondria panicea TaxID=6063 RepID=UPI00312B82C7